jgi:hypothetical protein
MTRLLDKVRVRKAVVGDVFAAGEVAMLRSQCQLEVLGLRRCFGDYRTIDPDPLAIWHRGLSVINVTSLLVAVRC